MNGIMIGPYVPKNPCFLKIGTRLATKVAGEAGDKFFHYTKIQFQYPIGAIGKVLEIQEMGFLNWLNIVILLETEIEIIGKLKPMEILYDLENPEEFFQNFSIVED